jgi:hypothetical protein
MRSLIFSLTLLISSFLLFLVQPMIGRMLLPSLGGTPAVWNGCMLFFQAALLAGYAWAHYGPPKLGVKNHLMVHLFLLAAVCCLLPMKIVETWTAPVDSNPMFWLLGQLTLCVGLPFFVISSSAPLLQRWFSLSAARSQQGSEPWFLYAISNFGSLVALISYPFVFERIMGLTDQGVFWATGFFVLALMFATCAFYTLRNADPASLLRTRSSKSSAPLSWAQRLRYIVLAAIPSSLMLGVTTIVSTDAGSFPLMWSIPLALYLITFILVFANRQLIPHRWIVRALPFCLLAMPLVMTIDLGNNPALMIAAHFAVFFIVAMACHGEMARLRPPVEQLTEFYLMMSLGGVVGGAFNSIFAPILFNSILEYPLVLIAACLVIPAWKDLVADASSQNEKTSEPSWLSVEKIWVAPIAILVILASVWAFEYSLLRTFQPLVMLFGFAVPATICIFLAKSPRRFAPCFALLLLGYPFIHVNHDITLKQRGFFGVNEIATVGEFRTLINGRTSHGMQRIDETINPHPLSYYHSDGPVGDLFREFGDDQDRIGVVGLGVGTIAAYGQPHQQIDFYEIDPIVYQMAADEQYFSYLSSATSDVNVILGDARVQLDAGRKQPGQLTPVTLSSGSREIANGKDNVNRYGMIVLDAFGSDSVPIHLLTEEAIQLYLDRLDENGLLAIHISSKFMNFAPVGAAFSDAFGLHSAIRTDSHVTVEQQQAGRSPSRYMIFSRDKNLIQRFIDLDKGWQTLKSERPIRWTDEHANILDVMVW